MSKEGPLTTPDYLVVVLYVLLITSIGWLAGRKRGKDLADFFLGGRTLPWWLLGTSMVATTLAADTPLTVAGLTLEQGVAGNWFWWSFAASHVLVAVILGPLWRRSSVITDAELCELRYPGRAAVGLRALKAFYFALPINCFTMGWVILAMVKVSSAVLPEVPSWVVIAGLLALVLVYSVRSGFHAVVLTDLVQFPIALAGTIVLAWVAVDHAGGLDQVVAHAVRTRGPESVDLFPLGSEALPWHLLAVFVGVQWWAWKSADGGGIFIQRLLGAKDEREATRGGLWFCIAHYVLRPWPWIVAALAAAVLVPDAAAADPEQAYAQLIVEVLPPGLRGLLVAGFLAAFMSTMDTHLNWGASYVANDLIGRFVPAAKPWLPRISRLAVIAMALVAVGVSLAMETLRGAWELAIAFTSGAGAVMLLRWFWWRVTAEAEIAAMLASAGITILVYSLFGHWPWSAQLLTITFGSAAIWVPVVLATAPAPAAVRPFYEKVRPPGPGWSAVAAATGGPAPAPLAPLLLRWLVWLAVILGALLGIGAALLSV